MNRYVHHPAWAPDKPVRFTASRGTVSHSSHLLQQQNENVLLFSLKRRLFHSENLKMPLEELRCADHYSFASYRDVFRKISRPRI